MIASIHPLIEQCYLPGEFSFGGGPLSLQGVVFLLHTHGVEVEMYWDNQGWTTSRNSYLFTKGFNLQYNDSIILNVTELLSIIKNNTKLQNKDIKNVKKNPM